MLESKEVKDKQTPELVDKVLGLFVEDDVDLGLDGSGCASVADALDHKVDQVFLLHV